MVIKGGRKRGRRSTLPQTFHANPVRARSDPEDHAALSSGNEKRPAENRASPEGIGILKTYTVQSTRWRQAPSIRLVQCKTEPEVPAAAADRLNGSNRQAVAA
jgi:hypothetical protein